MKSTQQEPYEEAKKAESGMDGGEEGMKEEEE